MVGQCVFRENAANGPGRPLGGGIYVAGASCSISGSRLEGNSALMGGGAWLEHQGTLSIGTSVISGNQAVDGSPPPRGGGVGCPDASHMVFSDCTLAGNLAGPEALGGGGLYAGFGADVVIHGCTIAGNLAEYI